MRVLMLGILLLTTLCLAVNPVLAEGGRELALSEVAWADAVTGYRNYEANEEGAFSRGTRAYAYFELVGFGTDAREDGRYAIDLSVDVQLRTGFGLRLFLEEDLIVYQTEERQPQDELWFYIWVDIPAWAPRANYVAVLVVHDHITQTTLQVERPIRVR